MDCIEKLTAILGEHYENYVIIAADGKHSAKLAYNDYFAAKGLLSVAKKTVDDSVGTGISRFEFDFGHPEDD